MVLSVFVYCSIQLGRHPYRHHALGSVDWPSFPTTERQSLAVGLGSSHTGDGCHGRDTAASKNHRHGTGRKICYQLPTFLDMSTRHTHHTQTQQAGYTVHTQRNSKLRNKAPTEDGSRLQCIFANSARRFELVRYFLTPRTQKEKGAALGALNQNVYTKYVTAHDQSGAPHQPIKLNLTPNQALLATRGKPSKRHTRQTYSKVT